MLNCDLFNINNFSLYFDDRELIQKIMGLPRDSSSNRDTLNKIYILSKELEDLKLNIQNIKILSDEASILFLHLIFNIVYNSKKYSINKTWRIIKDSLCFCP